VTIERPDTIDPQIQDPPHPLPSSHLSGRAAAARARGSAFPGDSPLDRVLELEAENQRLRRLVAELLASNQRIRSNQR
jgi:hypothetical protein